MDADVLNAIARGCSRWLLRHRSLFDPALGAIDESRITAACELALLAWLLLRDHKSSRLSHRSHLPTLLRAALACVQRWQQSSPVQAIFAGGPIEAWSGELALAVPTHAPADRITMRTRANLPRVDADRQLEWCWWCMQIDPAVHWQQQLQELTRHLLIRTLANPGPLVTRDAYRLTHLIFYGTDFGRTALPADGAMLAALRRILHRMLLTHAHNRDLIAEILVSLCCLGWQGSDDAHSALHSLRCGQLPHGAFVDADALAAYHTCLVLLLPAVQPCLATSQLHRSEQIEHSL